MRTLGLALVVALSTVAAGCGAHCDSQNVCAVSGKTGDEDVCNGSDFVTCDDSHRGQTILCPTDESRKAVCSTDGWVFEAGGQ